MTPMLSRLLLNPLSQEVRRDMASVVQLHRTVMGGFPDVEDEPRKTCGVLFRLDVNQRRGHLALLVQSHTAPSWTNLPSGYLLETDDRNPDVKRFESLDSLTPGRELTFRLRANPTKRVTTAQKTQRVELRGDDARLAWLRRKAERGGFALCCDDAGVGILIREEHKAGGYQDRRNRDARDRVTIRPVLFEGRLRILDPHDFRRTVCEGIGPAKAYGCGLLSIAP